MLQTSDGPKSPVAASLDQFMVSPPTKPRSQNTSASNNWMIDVAIRTLRLIVLPHIQYYIHTSTKG
jgi:hypothetical protein